jgi:hypothetical protein
MARDVVDRQRVAPQLDARADAGLRARVRSTVIMSIDTRPTIRVRTPSTITGVPSGATRG